MRVTAAIPAYNAEAHLEAAIRSVLSQTRSCDEIIVVDDGSTDATGDVARAFSEVTYVRQPNGGDASARNRAISGATGDVMAFLDADDVWLPTKIDKQLSCFRADPELGMVYTGVEVVDAELRHQRILRPAEARVALRNTLLVEKPYMTGVGSSGMVRTAVARDIGFDERLRASADWAFACRVALSHRVAAIAEPLVQYRQHGDTQVHRNLAAVEADMRLVFAEIFKDPRLDPRLRRGSRRAHANLCLSLAASHFKNGDRVGFLRYLASSLVLRPDRVVSAFWRRYLGPTM